MTKRELIEKLERFPDSAKVYVGGQYFETGVEKKLHTHSIYACPIVDVETAPINGVPQILLIEDEQ